MPNDPFSSFTRWRRGSSRRKKQPDTVRQNCDLGASCLRMKNTRRMEMRKVMAKVTLWDEALPLSVQGKQRERERE